MQRVERAHTRTPQGPPRPRIPVPAVFGVCQGIFFVVPIRTPQAPSRPRITVPVVFGVCRDECFVVVCDLIGGGKSF